MAKARLCKKIADTQGWPLLGMRGHGLILVAMWRTMHTMSTRERERITVQLSCTSSAQVGGVDKGVRRPEVGIQAEGRVSGNRRRADLCEGSECVTAGDRCRGPLSP